MAEKTLAEMLAPQISESDATMVDVYGLKSQAADNMSGVHLALGGLGMIPAVGNIADVLDAFLYLGEGDIGGAGLSALSALPFAGLLAGGLKTVKGGAKALEGVAGRMPKMSGKMPRTQTYQYPSTNPQYQTRANTKVRKLKDKLNSDELDAVEELQVRRELQELEPDWKERPYYEENWY